MTKKDSYPQPSAEELLLRLAGHRFFTKLDLKSGYFQIPITEPDKEKTAFVTPDGHYEFNVLPQGLMNAPATFQRVMNNLIATGRWDYVVVYLDDIVIFSNSFEEHLRHVHEILSILNRAHFKVSPPKCSIASSRIEFLGHIVTATAVEPSPDKVQAILDIQPPRTLSQANRFLGKIGYYRKFIADFARLAAPLHKVSNKTWTRRHEFYWHSEQQEAFDTFKGLLTQPPLFLHFPEPDTPFILSTDASITRIAGVLKQNTTTGLKVCYYKSRLLNDVEQRYSTTEHEALAIYWCLDQLRHIIGTSPITIETDHQPLVDMHLKYSLNNNRIDNWLLKIQDLLPQILSIRYRKGVDNAGPDFLTRYEPLENSLSLEATTAAATAPTMLSVTDSTAVTPPPLCSTNNSSVASDLDCRPGTDSPNSIIVSPVITRSAARLLEQPSLIPSSTTHKSASNGLDSSSSPLSHSVAPSMTTCSDIHSDVDFSLSRIHAAQHLDPAIVPLFASLRNSPPAAFVLHDEFVHRQLIKPHTDSTHVVPWLPTYSSPWLFTHTMTIR